MFGLKIIVTIIITLIIVLGFLALNPTVAGFFENIFDRFSGIAVFEFDTTQRNVLFSLDVNKFDNITVKTRRLINITTAPDNLSILLKDGSIVPDKTFIVYGFRGHLSIKGNEINLDGKYDKFEYLDKSTSFDGGDIKAEGTYINLTIKDFALNELKLNNVTGKIVANEVKTIFSEVDIDIKSPLGKFVFNGGLKIDGSASKISIPNRNLVIS